MVFCSFYGVAADWPCAGLFSVLKLDNAAEFHAHALRRACEQYGVTLDLGRGTVS